MCRPIGDVVVVSVYRWHLPHSSGGLRHQFQSVRQAALGQLDLESVLALRLGVAQRRLRRLAKNVFVSPADRSVRPRPRAIATALCPRRPARRARASIFPPSTVITTAAEASANSIRRPVAQLQIKRAASGRGRRQRDVRDQVARLEHRFAVRRVAGQQMKIADRNAAFAFRSAARGSSLPARHGHAHVGWIGRDAMFARAEDGEATVDAGDRRAAGARLALVARHRGVAEVHAARSLQQVARRRRHVAKLRRRAAQKRLRQHRIILPDRSDGGRDRNCEPSRRSSGRRREASSILSSGRRLMSTSFRGVSTFSFIRSMQRRPAGDEAHVRALLRRLRLGRDGDRLPRDRRRE